MFVCKACHDRMLCKTTHSALSFGPCELCRKEGATSDCIGRPATKEELEQERERRASYVRWQNKMYHCCARLEYPRVNG